MLGQLTESNSSAFGNFHLPSCASFSQRSQCLTAVMSAPPKYLLVSLPLSISSGNDREEAHQALQSSVQQEFGSTVPFSVPTFKIGTLDALVQQADELSKLSADCEGVVGKAGDSLTSILEGDAGKIAQQKNISDSAYGWLEWL